MSKLEIRNQTATPSWPDPYTKGRHPRGASSVRGYTWAPLFFPSRKRSPAHPPPLNNMAVNSSMWMMRLSRNNSNRNHSTRAPANGKQNHSAFWLHANYKFRYAFLFPIICPVQKIYKYFRPVFLANGSIFLAVALTVFLDYDYCIMFVVIIPCC